MTKRQAVKEAKAYYDGGAIIAKAESFVISKTKPVSGLPVVEI